MNSELMYDVQLLQEDRKKVNEVTDAHFHFHNEGFCRGGRRFLFKRFEQLQPYFEEHNVTKINAIFLPCYKKFASRVQNMYKGINTGLYLFVGDEPKKKLKQAGSDFDFIKLRGWLLDDPLMTEEGFKQIVNKCVKLGYDKFQLHTTILYQNQIGLLHELTQTGLKFYLAHGADALKSAETSGEKINYEELKELKGKIFIGTSFSDYAIISPMDNITLALKNGLEDMLCFETDYLFNHKTDYYNTYYTAINETIGHNKKIMSENCKEFL